MPIAKSMLAALDAAIVRREALRTPANDTFRVVDGDADGLPGIHVDEFAGHWLVQTRDLAVLPEGLAAANPRGSVYWKPLGDKRSPRHVDGPELTAPFVTLEAGLRFQIDFNAGYSQGLFIDQRANRARLRQLCRPGAPRHEPVNVLNCFAYTCAFGVAAAVEGAFTVNIDLSRPYLEWGRQNYALNDIDPAGHDFVHGDVARWLKTFAKRDRRFDVILLDPPTFSHDARGRAFSIEKSFAALVRQSVPLLTPSGSLFCSTNQHSLTAGAFEALVREGLSPAARWIATPGRMPPDFRGSRHLKSLWLKRG